jgi:hypothetical protein
MRWKARRTSSGWRDTGGGRLTPLGLSRTVPREWLPCPTALATLEKVGVSQFGQASGRFPSVVTNASLKRAGP